MNQRGGAMILTRLMTVIVAGMLLSGCELFNDMRRSSDAPANVDRSPPPVVVPDATPVVRPEPVVPAPVAQPAPPIPPAPVLLPAKPKPSTVSKKSKAKAKAKPKAKSKTQHDPFWWSWPQ
jgi:hypothetical protein